MAKGFVRFNRPSSGLQVANAIAQGASGLMSGYMGAQKVLSDRARQQAEIQLRQQQMRLMQQEQAYKYGPVKISLQKLGMLEGMARAGIEVPGSVTGKAWNEMLDNISQTPEVIPAINAQVTARGARQYTLPDQTRSESLPMAPDPKYPSPNRPLPAAPGNVGANTELKFGGMEINAPVPQREQPDEIELSRAEYDLFSDARKAATQERVAQRRGEYMLQSQNLRNASEAQLLQYRRDVDMELERIRQEGQNQRNQATNASAERRAKTMANARQQSNTPAQLDRKSILSQIQTYQRQKGELYKPNSLGMTMPSEMAKQQEAWYDQQITGLNQQLSKLPPEKPAAPQKAAPAKPAAAAPAKTAPKSKVPPSGLPKRWDPEKNPNPRGQFQNGDIVDVVSGPNKGMRIRFDDMDKEEMTVIGQ